MLEQYCSHSKQCNNNVVTLCCAKIVPCNITLRASIMKFACWGACSPFRVSNAFQIDVLNLVTCSSTPGLTWEPCSVVEVPEEAFLPADKSLDERKKWLCSSSTITGYPFFTFWTSPVIHLDCHLFWGTNKVYLGRCANGRSLWDHSESNGHTSLPKALQNRCPLRARVWRSWESVPQGFKISRNIVIIIIIIIIIIINNNKIWWYSVQIKF